MRYSRMIEMSRAQLKLAMLLPMREETHLEIMPSKSRI